MAKDDQSLGVNGEHWTRGRMLRHPLYWMTIPMLIAPAAFATAFFFHQVHLAEVKGWSHLSLVSTFPIFTAAAIVSLFASGPIIDRVGTARLMPLTILPMGLGFAGGAGFGDVHICCCGISPLKQKWDSACYSGIQCTPYLYPQK